MTLRIMSIMGGGKWTGAAVPALEQAARLSAAGHAVLFACAEGPLREEARRRNVAVFERARLPSGARAWEYWRDFRTWRDCAEIFRPDVVLVHRTPEMLTCGAALQGAVPVVRVWHDGRGRMPGGLLRACVRRLGVLVAGTSSTVACAFPECCEDGAGTPIFRTAIDPVVFNPDGVARRLRAALGVGPDDVLVGAVGRWKADRRWPEVMDILADICRAEPSVRGVLLGRGEMELPLRDVVKTLGMEGRIHLASAQEYPDALASFDIGLAYMPGSDGSSRAALEMAAMARPVVVQRFGALADYAVYDGFLGIDTRGEWRPAVSGLVRDIARRQAMGAAARRTVLDRHAPAAVVRDEVATLVTLISRWRGCHGVKGG